MKYIFIALVAILLASCGAILDPIADVIIDKVFLDYPYLEEPLESVWQRSSKFRYENEGSGIGYWKSPREFEHDGGGDCEDFSAWMIYHLGKNARCAMIHRLKDPHGVNHSVVVYNGQLIEPQKYGKVYEIGEYIPISEISYDAVMKLSTAMNTK